MERNTHTDKRPRRHIAGNALAMVFMAVGMAGVVTYGLNNIMRGPAVTAAETSRRTIAENNLVATTRLAITAAAQMQSNKGDCDGDGFVEPVPFRTAAVGVPAPAGGGLVPMTIGASMTDPWGMQYGYCVWDPGTVSQSDNHTGCGNAAGDANRLQGAPRDDQPAIAVISAGKNGTFDTTCNPYVDDDNDGQPDDVLVEENTGSDDIVLTYTYAEANGIGGGLWKLRDSDPTTAEIDRGIRSTSRDGATFGGSVELTNRGIVLPGDPGDDSVTGPCDAAKNGQLRRNTFGSPPAPPTIEMCDHTGGNGWIRISGSGEPAVPEGFNPQIGNCTRNESGPFSVINTISSGHEVAGIWTGVGMPLQQIQAANSGYGVIAGTFDGTNIVGLASHTGSTWSDVWSNGGHIFASGRWNDEQLVALTFDGSTYTEVARVSFPGMDVDNITGSGDVIFVPIYDNAPSGGLRAYRFTGTSFTLLDTFTVADAEGAANTDASDVWTNGADVFYTSHNGALRAAQWNGSQFVNKIVANQNHRAVAVWSDGNFVYTVGPDSGFAAYSYNGTNLTRVFQSDDGTDYTDIWGDGVYLYATTTTGIRVLIFDGSTLQIVDQETSMGASASVWGDGNYVYVGTVSGLYVLGGYGCMEPNPDGGSPVTTPPPSTRVSVLPEPLDVGLVAHWKMEEDNSMTAVNDSVGTHHGEKVDTVTTVTGQDGGLAFNLGGPTNNSAIRINSLLGEQRQGTIAGWVNLGSTTEIAGPDPDRAMIISIGNNVNLYENYDTESTLDNSGLVLEVNSGGTLQAVRSNVQLTGTGWRYVVATFDPDDEMFRIYVDGKMVAQENQAWSVTYGGGGSTFIGRHSNEANWNLKGSVDDFRVYSRALGPAEVAALSARHLSMGESAPSVLSPLHVAGKTGQVSIGNLFACGIKQSGTLWCWGMDDGAGALGNGIPGASSRVPVQVVEPSQFVYYMNNTNSGLTVGGATFNKKMLPYMQQPQAPLGAYAASQSKTAYGFTDPGMPGIVGVTGSREYTVKMRLATPDACLSAGAIVARINSAGTLQSSVTLAAVGGNTLSSTVTLKALGNLGTFAQTDRLRVQYSVNNTCASARLNTNLIAELHAPIKPHSPWVFTDRNCGIKGDGTAWCWGYGGEGGLGNSAFTSANQSTPSPVVHNGVAWASLSGYADHTCGIKSDGSLWCWGDDVHGQLGNGATAGTQYEPFRVGTDNDWANVQAAYTFACGLKTNGTAWCWGDDARGQLGNGATNTVQASPVQIADTGPWIKLTVSNYSACGIKSDSSLWCWGANDNFKLGTKNGQTDVPTRIWGYPDGWVDVAQGVQFTCGTRKDGNVYCWGAGGNLARGWHADTHVPQKVFGLTGAVSLVAGGHHACATKTDDAVYCWGWNGWGTLGDGAYRANGDYPTAVLGFPDQPGWGWNDAQTIINAPYNANVGLNGSMIGDIGNNARGFGFTSSGRARLYQDTAGGVQLGLQAGAGGSSLVSFKTTPAMGAIDVTYGLTGRWPLDANANASVGGINGTNNGATFITERKAGAGALLFDGIDDYVQFNRSAAVMEHGSLSVAFWVRTNGLQAYDANILTKLISTGLPSISYVFTYMGNNTLSFVTGHTDNTQANVDAYVPDEKWTHIVGTFSPTGTNNLKLYIDGKLAGTTTKAVALQYDTSANGRLTFGNCPTCINGFKGALDDVRIYDRAITANEIAILYGTQLAATAPDFTMGVNQANNRFQFSTPTDTLMNIQTNGLTGIGPAVPTTRLDVQGGVRFGSEAPCDANRTGALRYTGGATPWTHCNGTAWVPLPSATSVPWKNVLPGWNRACGIRADGSAWCWGDRMLGNDQDGPGVNAPTSLHRDNSDTPWNDWTMIDSGYTASCGIRADGSAWCWGEGGDYGYSMGRLGNGTNDTQLRPTRVRTDGGGTGWNDWKMISTGLVHTCGIRGNGTAWCWGNGGSEPDGEGNGKLGNGTDDIQLLPAQVIADTGPDLWSDWISIKAGERHTCGIRADRSAWCWGNNNSRQLGRGDDVYSNRPVRVRTDSGATGWNDWAKVEPGIANSCGIRVDGTMWCWGNGLNGNSAGWTTNTFPARVRTDAGAAPGWGDWVDVSVGDYFQTCGIRADGSAWCWGVGNHGVLGNGNTGLWIDVPYPTRVLADDGGAGWSDWLSIHAGRSNTCGIRRDGSAWCWGYGGHPSEPEWSPNGNGMAGGVDIGYPSRVAAP